MVKKRLDWKWCGFWMGSKIRKPNHLKSGQKRLYFEWSGLQMVGTIATAIAKGLPFENWTIWNPTLKKYKFQMVRFQIPTVVKGTAMRRLLKSNEKIRYRPQKSKLISLTKKQAYIAHKKASSYRSQKASLYLPRYVKCITKEPFINYVTQRWGGIKVFLLC